MFPIPIFLSNIFFDLEDTFTDKVMLFYFVD